MVGKEFADYIRFVTRTNSSTFTDAQIVTIANVKRVFLAKKIESVDENYFGSPEFRDLVASSVSREYPLPSDMLSKLKRVEAKIDGEVWIPLKRFDLNMYDGATDEDTIIANFGNTKGTAKYHIYRNSLWLYTGTIPAYDEGNKYLKLWSYAYPAKLVEADLADEARDLADPSDDDDNGIPMLMHELWADMVSVQYKATKQKPIPLTQQEKDIPVRLRDLLEELRGMDRDYVVEQGSPDTSKNGDNGYNY